MLHQPPNWPLSQPGTAKQHPDPSTVPALSLPWRIPNSWQLQLAGSPTTNTTTSSAASVEPLGSGSAGTEGAAEGAAVACDHGDVGAGDRSRCDAATGHATEFPKDSWPMMMMIG